MYEKLTASDIERISYTEFVSLINQWNVPPGSLDTINRWAVFGHVGPDSNVLDIACSTGLSSREMARLTGCRATGIDICPESVAAARLAAEKLGSGLTLRYECADAGRYHPASTFTHLIVGASFAFFRDANTVFRRLTTFFGGYGYLLASPYYSHGEMPEDLKQRCREIIGITPTTMSYDMMREQYQDFEVVYEQRNVIEIETEEQMRRYTRDCIDYACELRKITSPALMEAMARRLYAIKEISNEMHRHQAYSVLVLRYFEGIYPKRLVELF